MVSVRPAAPTDVRAVRAVARPAWHATYDDALGRATVDGFVDAWYDPDALRRDVADDGPFVVAERDRSVVGFAQATGGARAVSEAGRRGPSEASLARLYVHPDDWGTGVGTALLGATARRLGPATRLRAVVMASNAVGRGFYERHGFRVRERRETTLRGVSFEVVVLVSPLAPLRGLSPAVDDERTGRDGWDVVDAGDGSDDADGRDGAGEAAGRQG